MLDDDAFKVNHGTIPETKKQRVKKEEILSSCFLRFLPDRFILFQTSNWAHKIEEKRGREEIKLKVKES